MNKKLTKAILSGLVFASISVQMVCAYQEFHVSKITLPRTGTWKTVPRKATGPKQKMYVSDSSYDVYGRIVSNGGTALSGYQNHPSNKSKITHHNTGAASGDTLKGEFKTSKINYKTTTATLGWAP